MENKKAKIYYFTLKDEQRKEEKLDWFRNTNFQDIPFERIAPDEKGNWINLTDNDFESLIPVCSKEVKNGKVRNSTSLRSGISEKAEAIFELFSLGVATNRDEWVYDFDKENLKEKTKFFCDFFEKEKMRWQQSDKKQKINDFVDRTIKWTEELENHLIRNSDLRFDENNIVNSLYRPFVKMNFYFGKIITHRIYQNEHIFDFQGKKENVCICFSGISSNKSFQTLLINQVTGLDFLEKTNFLPLYRYENGERKENITDWALALFQERYSTSQRSGISEHYSTLSTVADLGNRTPTNQPLSKSATINKVSIFHYVYAVLHNPQYRQKYEQNLKRDFPRIPLYEDFWQWASWGKKLMDLHLNYETMSNYELLIINAEWENANATPKPKLKANKELGEIYIDEVTTLKGVPAEAWEYKLGNRSALEWVLDQYKESKPTDPTIAEKFNTYCFADYKAQVIDLLQKVCTVSVETIKIIREMQE